jgi:diguanylate cyclase (GGDEF)-like protein/putative nucleotidyltransferase with HDIG domain
VSSERDQPEIEHDQPAPPARILPPKATAYGAAVALAAIACAVPLLVHLRDRPRPWLTFAILATGAALSHIFTVRTARDSAFHTSWVFVIPAALLLPPPLLVLLTVGMHVPEWLKQRYPWYIQSFNICNYTLSILAAWGAGRLVLDAHDVFSDPDLRWAVAGLAVCAVAVAANHVILAPMITLARGHSVRESGVFALESLSIDFVLSTLGLAIAAFWDSNPWLIPFAIAPVFFVHRSLSVPKLQDEARVDPKTGLYNARHFSTVLDEELARAKRLGRPLSLIMCDLDLLREINNTHGHLAGDEVLRGISRVFRRELRHYDIPCRFGGEEFALLLPETPPEEAFEIAERVRRAVAAEGFDVPTSTEEIYATVSMGVAAYPRDADEVTKLVHHADVAVYRAKLQGRNRVLDAASEELLAQPEGHAPRLIPLPSEDRVSERVIPAPPVVSPAVDRRTRPDEDADSSPQAGGNRLVALVGVVGTVGTVAGVLGAAFGSSTDAVALVAIATLVAIGQAVSIEMEDAGSISPGAVGALMAAAVVGSRAALVLAVTMAAVEWSARRARVYHNVFNVGVLTLSSLAAWGIFAVGAQASGPGVAVLTGIGAGCAYFVVNTGLISLAVALESGVSQRQVWRERFGWLAPHYAVYGAVAAIIAQAYRPLGLWAIFVFTLPLVLMRKTQELYLEHTQRSTRKLRDAAETIRSQNASLGLANRLLKERSTAAMESLSATVDARDAYTAGHSRRVQELALAIGRRLGLSELELELLGYAALFHDIGKLAIPDEILLKPARLTDDQWAVMTNHAEEGAAIISRLGFLSDAVPAIRHHHERYDGAGYPDGLAGEEIPLGARIIHVADAFDSMLTSRVYRAARPAPEALEDLRRNAGTQFCPRCVTALEGEIAARGETSEPISAA